VVSSFSAPSGEMGMVSSGTGSVGLEATSAMFAICESVGGCCWEVVGGYRKSNSDGACSDYLKRGLRRWVLRVGMSEVRGDDAGLGCWSEIDLEVAALRR
jgi:hypothetical protein